MQSLYHSLFLFGLAMDKVAANLPTNADKKTLVVQGLKQSGQN